VSGEPPGSTPLDPDEARGLIPSGVATREDLDALEQAAIAGAQEWALQRPRPNALTEGFLRALHRRMFGEVWRWAGKYRTSDKNLGVPWQQVPTHVGELVKNTLHQVKVRAWGWDEWAARFHHRLVVIHPFPNGNGRHARLCTDVVLRAHGQALFTWGAVQPQGARARYLAALRAADGGDFKPLLDFVRS
jgi:Fic-DOC domain mobile mystery protein B